MKDQDPIVNYTRRKKGRKRYAIQVRATHESDWISRRLYPGLKWRTCRRFHTRKAMQKFLESSQLKTEFCTDKILFREHPRNPE